MPPQIKLCGFTTFQSFSLGIQSGADFLGINFIQASRRYISLDTFKQWLPHITMRLPKLVAVLISPSDDFLHELTDSNLFYAWQFHGQESVDYIYNARTINPDIQIWKAVSVTADTTQEDVAAYAKVCDRLLLDSPKKAVSQTFQFPDFFAEVQAAYPNTGLAGGIKPTNVADFVSALHPALIDVASGVESGVPGVKDVDKITEFLQILSSFI